MLFLSQNNNLILQDRKRIINKDVSVIVDEEQPVLFNDSLYTRQIFYFNVLKVNRMAFALQRNKATA